MSYVELLLRHGKRVTRCPPGIAEGVRPGVPVPKKLKLL